jgi:D-xylose transport system permease protein
MSEVSKHRVAAGAGLHSWAMAGVLLLLWAILAVLPATRDYFLTQRNLVNLSVQVSHIAVVAVGMTLVIIIRGIDLSVGAGVALTGVVAALLQIDHGMPVWVAIPAALVAGAVIGGWQGFWIARFNIPAFVVTLAGFNAFRGLALVASDARGLSPLREDFAIVTSNLPPGATVALIVCAAAASMVLLARDRARRRTLDLAAISPVGFAVRAGITAAVASAMIAVYGDRGMPVPVLLAISAVLFGVFLTRKTRFGRHIYAIGGNPEAARLSGINVVRTTMWVYVLIGVLTAVAGIILAGRVNGVTPGNAGSLLELDVITAVVIGGTSLSGGRGSVVGSLLGALVFGTLSNGMNLLDVDSNWQLILKGMILMAAVMIDVLSKRKRA